MREKLPLKRKLYAVAWTVLMGAAAAVVCALLLGIIGYVFYRGLPGVTWKLLSSSPSVLRNTVGILPNLLNTLYMIVMTLVLVLPLGVGAAVYLTEYAKNARVVSVIEFATQTLSGIPSIIYGLVGMLLFSQTMKLESSLLAGSLTLTIMTLPTVIRTTQESLKTVPNSWREGALGLGAGKWHTIRTVVLPSCVDGIVTGCILTVGRIVGESAALMYTAGMVHEALSPLEAVQPGNAGASLTVAMYVYAKERGDFETAFAIAAILLVLTFVINITAKRAGETLKK